RDPAERPSPRPPPDPRPAPARSRRGRGLLPVAARTKLYAPPRLRQLPRAGADRIAYRASRAAPRPCRFFIYARAPVTYAACLSPGVCCVNLWMEGGVAYERGEGRKRASGENEGVGRQEEWC